MNNNIQIVQCPACKAGLKIKNAMAEKPVACPNCSYKNHISFFSVLKLKKVKCNKCDSILSVGENITGRITCPNCKIIDEIDNFSNIEKKKGISQPIDNDRTMMPEMPIKQANNLSFGSLCLIEGNCYPETIKLKKGINIIGKKSISSISTIQLDTTDPFISRQHFNIDVIENGDSIVEYRLSDAGSKNGTVHNGEKIVPGDIIVILPDDIITIGKTSFRFEIKI